MSKYPFFFLLKCTGTFNSLKFDHHQPNAVMLCCFIRLIFFCCDCTVQFQTASKLKTPWHCRHQELFKMAALKTWSCSLTVILLLAMQFYFITAEKEVWCSCEGVKVNINGVLLGWAVILSSLAPCPHQALVLPFSCGLISKENSAHIKLQNRVCGLFRITSSRFL